MPELREELQVRVLRPIEEELEELPELPEVAQAPRQQLRVWMSGRHQEKLLIAAPLQVGDALIYDSRSGNSLKEIERSGSHESAPRDGF